MADFTAATTTAMFQLEPVRFHLEKGFVMRQPFRSVGVGCEPQSLFGIRFNFSDQVLHGCQVADKMD